MEHDDRLIGIQELAAYLEVPVKTLYAWRYHGDGPPGFRVGKHIRYQWTDVQEWVKDQLKNNR